MDVNGGPSSKGVLVPVSESSDIFDDILTPLQNAYLYEESKHSFRYKSAFLIKNDTLQEKYDAFRVKRRAAGYSEEDLKDSYGFLLFDDLNKAKRLGETGVLTGNCTCTTLGDPSKGVYISKHSDCLDLNRWYHGKSGFIVIIRLTKGRVKKVSENYTQNFTAPSVGFDCHESEQLSAVSANTSSFLAFERTQYYMYELLHNENNEMAQESPSHACPFAIVSFSYADTKAKPSEPQAKSVEEKKVFYYLPWSGQLKISSQLYYVGLKSTTGALIPAKLPAVMKVDGAISMLDLRQLVPKAVFETCFSGEVSLDGICCSLHELVPTEVEDSSLTLLTRELKEKDLALTIQLNDGGFLILLHSSHFLTYDDTGSSAIEVLQGMFLFPSSRAIQRDTKVGRKKPTISSEILQVLPALNYAEGEVEKRSTDQSEELCGLLAQHIQSFAALINPGLATSPSREVSIFPDQYDVPDALKYLYSAPKWTNRMWQSVRSYLSQPVSFQLPVSRATELLAVGQEDRTEDLDNEVYICLSSPEEPPATSTDMCPEDQLGGQEFPAHVETFVGCHTESVKAQVDLTSVPQNEVLNIMPHEGTTKDSKRPGLKVLTKTDDISEAKSLSTSPISGDLPTEFVVSITSAEGTATVLDDSLSMISAVSATQPCEIQLSNSSTAKLQMAGVNSLNDKAGKAKKPLDCPKDSNPSKTDCQELPKGQPKGSKKSSKSCVHTSSLSTAKLLLETNSSMPETDDMARQPSDNSGLNNASRIDWRKLPRRRRKGGKMPSKYKKIHKSALAVKIKEMEPVTMEVIHLTEPDTWHLRKKTERWDLKPIITRCGRILVPHGSVDIVDQINYLKDNQKATDYELCPDKIMVDGPVKAPMEIDQEPSPALETKCGKTHTTKNIDGGDHLQNVDVSHVNSEQSNLRRSDNGNSSITWNSDTKNDSSENIAKADSVDLLPSELAEKHHTDIPSQVKDTKKSEFLLSKLKKVLLKGKRKTSHLVSEDAMTPGTTQGTEPSLKKSKADSYTEMLKSDDSLGVALDTGAEEASMTLPVDPDFAHALGLTPKALPDKAQKTQYPDTQLRRDPLSIQDEVIPQTISDKLAQHIQRPSSSSPGKLRMKTLKKQQNISTEYVRKKWWLHFHTPASVASERLKHKGCSRNNSDRKKRKEHLHTTCQSTDGLTLLADLALSDSNDQVAQQPEPAQTKRDSGLEMCDLAEDDTGTESETIIHALLKQTAARPICSPKSPSPKGLAESKDVVGLISKEHAYSLPPSPSLLLGLPGIPFQIPSLSGSAGLQKHHQIMYGDGTQALHAFLCQEDKSELECTAPNFLKKDMVRRRKFRHSRTFIEKNGSIQVTRQWKGNYDFDLDSKFTNDSKDKTITRALHGPWDFTIQDTNEEVRLIVHMWIGLFYSRSTARFFDIDTSLPYSETADCMEMSSGMGPAPTPAQLKNSSSASIPILTSDSDVLDLGKNETPVLNQGSVVLDLSVKKPCVEDVSSDSQVGSNDISVSHEQTETVKTCPAPKPSVGLHEAHTKCLYQAEDLTFQSIDTNQLDDRSTCESGSTNPSQKAGNLEQSDVISCKSDGPCSLLCNEMASVSIQQEDVLGTKITVHSQGSNNDNTDVGDCNENQGDAEIEAAQQVATDDSSKTMAVDSNCESVHLIHQVEQDENKSKDGDHQEHDVESCLPVIDRNDDSTNKDTVHDINPLKNEGPSAGGESKALSRDLIENVNEDKDDLTVHDDSVFGDDVQFGMENATDLKGKSFSLVHAGSGFIDKPLAMTCDGHGSVGEDPIEEDNGKVSVTEQPLQVDSEDGVSSDSLHCANDNVFTDKDTISVQDPNPALDGSSYKQGNNESVDETKLEPIGEIHSTDEALLKKTVLPTCNDNSFGESDAAFLFSQDGTIGESQNEVKADFSVVSTSYQDQDDKSAEVERKVSSLAQNAASHQQSQSTGGEISEIQTDQMGTPWVREADFNRDIDIERPDKMYDQVVIPFIGIQTSRNDTSHSQVLCSDDKAEEVVQGQEEMAPVRDYCQAILDTDVHDTSQENSEKALLLADKTFSVVDPDSHQEMASKKSEWDERCPTPTVDEKPYDYILCPDPCSSASAYSSHEVCKRFTGNDLSQSSTPTHDEMPVEQECCYKSGVNRGPNPNCDLPHGEEQVHPGPEFKTLRDLGAIEKHHCKSICIDKSSQFETTLLHPSQAQTPGLSSKSIPINLSTSHISTSHYKGEEIQDINPAVASVQLQPKETYPSSPEHYSNKTCYLQDTSLGQDSWITSSTEMQKADLQYNVCHDLHSYSQRPVMAVKPSKNDESPADYIYKERQTDTSVISDISKDKQTKTPDVAYTTLTDTLTESSKCMSEDLNENEQDGNGNSSKANWVSGNQDTVDRFALSKAKLAVIDALYRYRKREISNFKIPSPSVSMHSFEAGKSSSRSDNRNQDWLQHCLVEKVWHTTEDRIETVKEDQLVTVSDSILDYKGSQVIDEKSLIMGPSTSSLKRTVYNPSRKASNSLVEQLSQRCQQSDPTQSSMEQECLIFSDQLKQLLKRSRGGPSLNQTNIYNRSMFSCPSPVTVCFSSLQEQEDSVDHLEGLPSLVGQRIKVDMPERRGLTEATEGENTFHLHRLSYGKCNAVACASVSDTTAECAKSYQAMMNDVCTGKKLPITTEGFKKGSDFSKSDPSDHFGLTGQMRREMFDNLHSSLNFVVRQSCKTKFRFYILVTSDDAFFDETKAQLKAEGHTEVQPFQFFLGEESSSSTLLIILRNEDIAEHICEVPHLLELKKSPDVLFAGIDQPDDIVNLTHQELFNRGGFMMFERTALDALSLCNMKKMLQFLEELSKKGKWKWVLHYRDSRSLKENARLSAEAKEKKDFMDCCQETGIVEVLPYHECDLMSRDKPNYLNCLIHLQIQNISSRFPVFITDTTADSAFGRNGILTMNINSFLIISQSETCTIS
ncbi:uncharacterized protein tasor2 isoform 1-T1 [Polymixia lowei]